MKTQYYNILSTIFVISISMSFNCKSITLIDNLSFKSTSRIDEAIPPSIKNKIRIALFDTHRRCPYVYQPLLNGAKTVNMHIEYYSIDSILDNKIEKIPLQLYQGAIFVLCPEFLKAMHGRTSLATKKTLDLIEAFSKYKSKLTVLMLPSMPPQQNPPLFNLSQLIQRVGMTVTPKTVILPEDPSYSPKLCSLFFKTSNNFLRSPLEYRSFSYHTSLQNPRPGQSFQYSQVFNQPTTPIAFLPIKQQYPAAIKATLPYGVYWFNPVHKNHLIISNASLLTFAGISVKSFLFFSGNITV